jgi:transposase InsO family protein
MSDKPKLATKYENDDPDFTCEAGTSDNTEKRVNPARKVKTSLRKSLINLFAETSKTDEIANNDDDNDDDSDIISISSDSDSIEGNITSVLSKSNSPLSFHTPDSNVSGSTTTNDNNQFSPFHTQANLSTTNTHSEMDEAAIGRLVKQIVQNLQPTVPRQSNPKIEIPTLKDNNYVFWAKNMKSALSFYDLWVDPSKPPETLSESEKLKNVRAALFVACHLDDQNSSLINHSIEKCFISIWNAIEKFHQPRTPTLLTDIFSRIHEIQHQPGQSITVHLMKLEAEFARLHQINKSLSEDFLVAIILTSVKSSPEFANVFHSAIWEDESSLTVAKVKAILITTQRKKQEETIEQAHQSRQGQHKNTQRSSFPRKRHNRKPRDPKAGWRCPECELDNHTRDNCFKRNASNRQQSTSNSNHQQSTSNSNHHVNTSDREESAQVDSVASVAQAYSAHRMPLLNHRLAPRIAPYLPTSPTTAQRSSVRNRLGARNIGAVDDQDDDVVNIFDDNLNLNYASGKNNSIRYIDPNSQFNSQKATIKRSSMEPARNNTVNCNLSNFNENIYETKIMKSIKNLNSNYSNWIIDSGATLHICNSRSLLSNFVSNSGQSVIISDGSSVPIEGYGCVRFFITNKNNKRINILLNHVAFVPDAAVNLISVRRLARLGMKVTFTEHSCYVSYNNSIFSLASISNSNYTLMIQAKENMTNLSNCTALTCIHEWHRKMSHRNIAQIKKMKDKLNLNITKCNCNPDCIDCHKGKLHALPFPQVAEKPAKPRDVVTTDVCELPTQSIGGSKYFVTFTCANTDYTEVATLKNKSDCKTELISYIQRCKTQCGNFPKVIRSDRGGEYYDEELQRFLKVNGIIFQSSVARCPQQNGISERKNRTLVEAVRTMLLARNLPNFLWAEALHHANNTFNSLPHEAHSRSPKELFFDRTFTKEFIEFGIPVYYTTSPVNRSKLDERGTPGIFVGIDQNSKGFRIFTNGKIRVERHVKFLKEKKMEVSNTPTELLSSEKNQEEEVDRQPTPELRRSERIRSRQANATSDQLPYEPKTYKQAIQCTEKEKWILAMDEELKSIQDNNTWTLVDLPKYRNAIGCRWVFKVKQGDTIETSRYKARLVAQGFTQQYGEDFDEVFAPVTRSSTFRILLAIASAQNLTLKQYDVKTAFLNGSLQEEIYMKQPPGFNGNKVLKLNKSLYGLKQAARVWNQTFNKAMLKENFVQSKFDECLFIYKNKSDVCYAIVHVDDLIFASNSELVINKIALSLNNYFELKCLGDVKNYLGIEISRSNDGVYSVCQTQYIQKIATEFQLEDSKGSKYPLDPGYHKLEDKNMLDSNNQYRKLIGMLLYVSTNTRPDISAAVGILSQRVSKPRILDFTEARRIVKYLMFTKNEKLHMFNKSDPIPLTAYADSDWAEDRETRKSISGVICKVFGGPVSWSSRKQNIVSTSTTESEFYALSEAVKETEWIKNILKDFDVSAHDPIIIHSDNQSTIKMVENSKFSSRTKHIDVRLHFVRECVCVGKIKLNYCPSEENVADLLTKPLPGNKMKYLRNLSALFE